MLKKYLMLGRCREREMLGTVWDEKVGKHFENPEAAVGNVLEACSRKKSGETADILSDPSVIS